MEQKILKILQTYEPIGFSVEYEDLSLKIIELFNKDFYDIKIFSNSIFQLLCEEYGEENIGLIEDYEKMFDLLWNCYLSY